MKLTAAFAPTRLHIDDESHLHKGHVDAREGGESHFRVMMVSPRFEGLSRVDRYRLVHDELVEELSGPVHALALTLLTPEEAAKRM